MAKQSMWMRITLDACVRYRSAFLKTILLQIPTDKAMQGGFDKGLPWKVFGGTLYTTGTVMSSRERFYQVIQMMAETVFGMSFPLPLKDSTLNTNTEDLVWDGGTKMLSARHFMSLKDLTLHNMQGPAFIDLYTGKSDYYLDGDKRTPEQWRVLARCDASDSDRDMFIRTL